MNGFVAWWAKNSVAANLLMALIIIVGIVTFFRLEREVFPSVELNNVNVSVSWPGASPREVEEQIVLRLEEAVAEIDNVKEVSSSAREGTASMTVEMTDGADFEGFLNEVKSRIDGVSNLPQSSFPPVVSRQRQTAPITWVAITADPEFISELELNRLARRFRDEVSQIPNGSPIVQIQGYRSEEVSIEVTETALRRYGLTFDDVAQAIRGASLDRSTGEVRTATGNVPLAVRQLADTEDEFAQIVIMRNPDGSEVSVADVAVVKNAFEDANFIFRVDGKPARVLQVLQPEQVNLVKTSEAIREWIDRKQSSLPAGVEMYEQLTMAEMYSARMELVSSNAFIGLILVLIVLMLFLRPTVAFWVAIGIAVSFLGTFIFMPYLGVSLNMLSLFALLLVIGIVVDDALIVGESIHRQTERGLKGLDAAIVGTQIVLKPVIFAVLTTMIAFSPFIFIGGGQAAFTQQIAYTVILALTFSLIESFMILPAHLAHLDRAAPKGLLKVQQQIADALIWVAETIYRPIIATALHMRYFTVVAFCGMLALSIALLSMGYVKFNFFPDVEQRMMEASIDMQRGTPFTRSLQIYERMQIATDQLAEELKEKNGGKDIIQSIETRVWTGGLNFLLVMADSKDRSEPLTVIIDRWRELIGPIPDAEDVNLNYNFTGGGGGRFVVSLVSNDLDQLTDAVQDVKAYFAQATELYDIGDSFESNQDELRFALKPGADRFGLTIGEISRQVRQAFYGEEAQRLPRDGQDVRVMVRYPLAVRESLESLDNMRIRTPDGREIALAAVADYTYAPAVRRIQRENRQRSARVWSRVREDADAGPLRATFFGGDAQRILAKYPDVQIKARGQDQEQQEFVSEVLTLYGIALFGMYMLLAIAFSSYFQPIMIMSAIPFGFMGALFGHLMLGENFAMFSIFGICAAGGVVINDNLVLVDYVNRLRREGAGALAALIEAGTVRFRPILLTSITTFIGLVPILLEQSFDAQFLRPMIISLAFGVAFALFVTLLFVPALYAVGVDIARFYRGLWTGEKQPHLGEGDSRNKPLPSIDPDKPRFDEDGSPLPAE